MKDRIIGWAVGYVLKGLNAGVIRKYAGVALDKLDDVVRGTENTLDDKSVLPATKILREALGI